MAFEGIKNKFNCLSARLQEWRSTELNAFILFTTLLFYMGLWPRRNDRRGFGAFYRKWLPRGIFMMTNYGMVVGLPGIIYQCFMAGDIESLLESIANIFAIILMYAHLYCLMFQKDKLRAAFVEMNVVREMGKRLPHQPDAILSLNTWWMEFVVFGLVLCGVVNFGVAMVLISTLYLSRSFPVNEWYPFDTFKSPVYEILYVSNNFRLNYLMAMMFLLYMIIWGMFMETVGQYRILSYNFNKVRLGSRKSRPESCSRLATRSLAVRYADIRSVVDEVLRQSSSKEKFKKRLTDLDILKICVQHHQSLVRFVRVVVSTFEPILFIHIICTLVPTGLAINLVLNTGETNSKVIMFFFLVIGCYLLLAVICFTTDKITELDEGIRDAIYGCDWLGAPHSFTRSMRIIMSYSNQPLIIKLAGFIPLSRENFYATMKLTYSYTMTMLTQFD